MTSTSEQQVPDPLLPERGTVWERWRDALLADPRRHRLVAWLVPALITAFAGVLRLANLAHPHELVFDETYYIKDAWTLLNLGYEASWPDQANESFLAGDVDVFRTDGSFVVHPPLGKWLIALGMVAFGPGSGFGWRVTTALVGTAAVLVLYFVAKRLGGSTLFAAIAAFLMAIDGLAIVMSRVALLDNALMLLVLVAFWFVLLDRERMLTRIAATVGARSARHEVRWGPVLWNRPWILAAGVALGAATAVKWSGLYALAGLGVYLVVTDAVARRRAGIAYWPTDAILRQGPVTFLLLVPLAAVVYLASWTGWLVTSGGYARDGDPNPFVALWKYHEAIYAFHVGLTTGHGYASPAWQWPFLVRPTSMYWHSVPFGEDGCGAPSSCVQAISSVPNPLIWFAGVAAVLYLVYRFVRSRDWRYAAVLTGVAITYVPWLLYPQRTIFQFYTIAILPFMLLALMFALRDVAGAPGAPRYRRASGQGVVVVFLAVVTLVSAFYYPVWTGMEVPYDFWRLHNWTPTWI
ncbi:MAG TPA: phospholipid carrier-dependent glycosyltransferase [Microbacterium sp.]|uniref:dolichyl-phosphate-mannose--protein mannosyltransferase n=1 Tax=Microbacterium sp. TaxID=51671 RepID=UPI002B9A15E9|nr:phospholipid carrier-dependent glycosyltransferase [Microbacterium sp.]HWI32347.1 phospholipid carrier-dependent glycosyltransferase [Microbacterium sp.]